MSTYEKLSLAISVIGVFVAIWVLVVYGLQLKAMRGQLDEMRSSSGQAKTALDATIAASRTDQRAWVTASIDSRPVAIGKPWEIVVRVGNAGKTPAVKVHSILRTVPLVKGADPFTRFGRATRLHMMLQCALEIVFY